MPATEVCSRVALIGFHRWPTAPSDVAYLRARHRHTFVVRAWIDVTHNDRDVEFHMLSRVLRDSLSRFASVHGEYEFGDMGCEHIAEFILTGHAALSRVEVWEDDEMGAVVRR